MRARIGRRAWRRVGMGLAVASTLAVVVTSTIHPTLAGWSTSASLGQSLGAASSSCTTPGVYRTTAMGRYLAGSVAGTPLPGASALAPLTADNPASTATFSVGATPQGADGASGTVTAAAAASTIAGLAAPAGSQTQYAAATSAGRSAAAAGAVTTSGALDPGTRAGVGTFDVSALLGAAGRTSAAGSLSALGLTVGSAGATANLNECARRWGASLSSALTRSASVSSMSLSTRDAAVTDLLTSVSDQRDAVTGAVSTLTGGSGTSTAESAIASTASTGLIGALNSILSLLPLGSSIGGATATVSVSVDQSAVATAAAATTTGGSGLVTLDGSTGALTADLGRLATASPAPNTAVLTAADATAIAAGTSTAAASLVNGVGSAWDAAVASTRIDVDVVVPVTLLGATILVAEQQLSGSVADFQSGSAAIASPLRLDLIGIPLGGLLSALTPLVSSLLIGPVRTTVAAQIASVLTSRITAAKAALATSLASTRAALESHLGVLPTLLSITLNEQPDVAPFPAPAAGTGSGYRVTALRLKVAGGAALDLAVANASVGPDRTINE